MKPFIEIMRPLNSAIASFAVFVGYCLSLGRIDYSVQLLFAMVSAFLIAGGGQAINDFFDAEVDRRFKPHRVIPRGEIERKTAFFYSLALFSAGMVFSYAITPAAFFIAGIFAALLALYSAFMQEYKFIGNAIVAAGTAVTLIYGASITGNYGIVIFLALSAFLANMGREITKDIEDMKGDSGRKASTPMMLGKRNAAMLVLLFYVFGMIIAAYVWFAGLVSGIFYPVLIAISGVTFLLAYRQLSNGDAHDSQRYSKGAMFIALLAFLSAVI